MSCDLVLIDPQTVRSRRVELGLTRSGLAKAAGTSTAAVVRLEEGADQSRYDLRYVQDLADALACDLTFLLARQEQPAAGDDPVELGRLLAVAQGPTSVEDLAGALGWDLERVHAALRALRPRLRLVGQHVRLSRDGMAEVSPVAGPPLVLDGVRQRDVERRGINITEARLMHRLVTQPGTHDVTPGDVIAAARLRAAGLAETDRRTDRLRLGDVGSYALCC